MYELDTRKIASLMFDRQLTVRSVSTIARLTPTTTSKIIRGKVTPNAKTIGKLAQALGVKGEELLKKEVAA
ncbi:MAG: helix-turn-helix transcriptional regulator [Selenomonadaceae bacterium]|nr:helix-turn-helix transcriptional regulator [Selenomonadaceae bacterium]